MDRRHAMLRGTPLPALATGAVLFADLSGFTAFAHRLNRLFGPRLGAEELVGTLNLVYSALISEVDRYGGSVTSFAGDAFTAWFPCSSETEEDSATLRAVACALAMQKAMKMLHASWDREGRIAQIGLKTILESGQTARFLAGDPSIQVIDMLVGPPVERVGAAAQFARNGDVLVGPNAAKLVVKCCVVEERQLVLNGDCFVQITDLHGSVAPLPWQLVPDEAFSFEQLRPWALPEIAKRLESEHDSFLTELRFTVSLFLGFGGLRDHSDSDALDGLDRSVRWVQRTVKTFEGSLLGVTIGDKGSYLYVAFGAPVTRGDDAARAVGAALKLISPPPDVFVGSALRIGIGAGQSRAGHVGGSTRTYGVMGDATNLSVRLMEAAKDGQILISARLASSVARGFRLAPEMPIRIKGKNERVKASAVLGRRSLSADGREERDGIASFIGRQEELAILEQHIERTLLGCGETVVVAGEAGIGKSRFAAQVIQRGIEAGLECLTGEAFPTETQTSYLAWRPILRALLGLDPRDPSNEDLATIDKALAELDPALVPRVPLLAMALGMEVPHNAFTRSLDPRLRKESLEDLFVQMLEYRARSGPLLVLVEDIHWLDPLSLDLLLVVIGAVTAMPVLLLTTYRPSDTARPFGNSRQNVREIVLPSLSDTQAAILVQDRLRTELREHGGPAFIKALVARAGGNPFYLEELISYAKAQEISPDDSNASALLQVPDSMASLVLAEIDRLSAAQQTTLRLASVIGRAFRADWLQTAFPQIVPQYHVEQSLQNLAELNLTPPSVEGPAGTYSFRHATIQEVVYESIPFALRAQLHDQFAASIEHGERGFSLDQIAYHYGRGRNTSKKREYFEKAARAAETRYANAVAIDYYRRLLELLSPVEEPPVLTALASVLVLTGGWGEADQLYRRAIDIARQANNRLIWAQAQLGLGKLQRAKGDTGAAALSLESACGVFAAIDDFQGYFDSSAELALVKAQQGEAETAQGLMLTCLDRAKHNNDAQRVARALHVIGNTIFLTAVRKYGKEDAAGAKPWWTRSLALHQELGNKIPAAALTMNLAAAALEEAEVEQAEVLVNEAMALFHEIGARWQYAHAHITRALVLFEKGDLRGSRAAAVACLSLSVELGALREISDALLLMAIISFRRSRSPGTARYTLLLFGVAYRLKRQGGDKLFLLKKRIEKPVAEAREILGEEQADAVVAAGEAMSFEDAIEYAFHDGENTF